MASANPKLHGFGSTDRVDKLEGNGGQLRGRPSATSSAIRASAKSLSSSENST